MPIVIITVVVVVIAAIWMIKKDATIGDLDNKRRHYLSMFIDFSVPGSREFMERILADEECMRSLENGIIHVFENAESKKKNPNEATIYTVCNVERTQKQFDAFCDLMKLYLRPAYDHSIEDESFMIAPYRTEAESGITETEYFKFFTSRFHNGDFVRREDIEKWKATFEYLGKVEDKEKAYQAGEIPGTAKFHYLLYSNCYCLNKCWGPMKEAEGKIHLYGFRSTSSYDLHALFPFQLYTKHGVIEGALVGATPKYNDGRTEWEGLSELFCGSMRLLQPSDKWSAEEKELARKNRDIVDDFAEFLGGKTTSGGKIVSFEWNDSQKKKCLSCKMTALGGICEHLGERDCPFIHEKTDLNSDVAYTEPEKAEPEKTELSKKEEIAKMIADAAEEGFDPEDLFWLDDEDEEEDDEFDSEVRKMDRATRESLKRKLEEEVYESARSGVADILSKVK